jgi:coenzyme F420-reducing hydrogenase beta subunit
LEQKISKLEELEKKVERLEEALVVTRATQDPRRVVNTTQEKAKEITASHTAPIPSLKKLKEAGYVLEE